MHSNNSIFRCSFVLLMAVSCLAWSTQSYAQENTDPASDSKIIKETLSKIRQVEQLDNFIQQNNELKAENGELKKQIASLDKQVKKLTQELKVENERLRKQLLQLPTFEVKSKLVGATRSVAVLQFEQKSIRIRQGLQMSVPVANGVWTLMKVLKISNEFIELEFPELERTILLYD